MVAHRHEAVEAAGGIKCHTDHDQQAGTAQLDAHTGQVAQNDRQHSHRSQEDGTDEGDLVLWQIMFVTFSPSASCSRFTMLVPLLVRLPSAMV